MIAHTQKGESFEMCVGSLPNGVAYVRLEVDARDTEHPAFLNWFTEYIMPRMIDRRKVRK